MSEVTAYFAGHEQVRKKVRKMMRQAQPVEGCTMATRGPGGGPLPARSDGRMDEPGVRLLTAIQVAIFFDPTVQTVC